MSLDLTKLYGLEMHILSTCNKKNFFTKWLETFSCSSCVMKSLVKLQIGQDIWEYKKNSSRSHELERDWGRAPTDFVRCNEGNLEPMQLRNSAVGKAQRHCLQL